MLLPIGSIFAAALVLVAQQIPNFDFDPSCRAAAKEAVTPGSMSDNMTVCRNKEQAARTEIARQWADISETDKAHCVPISTLGGTPTYTELLTCLELSREARRLHNPGGATSPPSTTGQDIR